MYACWWHLKSLIIGTDGNFKNNYPEPVEKVYIIHRTVSQCLDCRQTFKHSYIFPFPKRQTSPSSQNISLLQKISRKRKSSPQIILHAFQCIFCFFTMYSCFYLSGYFFVPPLVFFPMPGVRINLRHSSYDFNKMELVFRTLGLIEELEASGILHIYYLLCFLCFLQCHARLAVAQMD